MKIMCMEMEYGFENGKVQLTPNSINTTTGAKLLPKDLTISFT
jgi:hypothetical protein